MKRLTYYFAFISAMLFSSQSCLVENDMAYPTVLGNIVAFEVAGQTSVSIDATARTVNVVLAETADIQNIEVTRFDISPEATCETLAVGSVLDLSSPVKVVLNTYQQYEWTISATQPIERYVRCSGQVGDAEFRLDERRVYVNVADNQDITAIEIEALKFEPAGAVLKGYVDDTDGTETIVPIESFPFVLNCNEWRYFVVEYRGEEYRWGLYVTLVEVTAAVTDANAWARHVDLEGVFDGESSDPHFQYRTSSSDSWSDVTDVTVDGTNVTATVSGLDAATEYEVRLVAGAETSDAVTFTTEEEQTLHNMSFDNWYQDGNVWMPNLNASYQVWDSANPGSGKFGIYPTSREDTDLAVAGSGKYAAKMESKNAYIVLAAGNVYTGKFGDTVGLGAILDWGVPFSSRPSALKGYFKYNPAAIGNIHSSLKEMLAEKGIEYVESDWKNKPDTCQIQMLLTDWDRPFTVNTNEGTFVDFDNDSGIIAYGKMEYSPKSGSMSEYEEFRIDLDYRSTTRKPTYIVITVCTSKYGDYFTGGVGSTLLVDEFEFVYE